MVLAHGGDELGHLLALGCRRRPGRLARVVPSGPRGVELVGERLERLRVRARGDGGSPIRRGQGRARAARALGLLTFGHDAPGDFARGTATGNPTSAVARASSIAPSKRRRDAVARVRQRGDRRDERETLADDTRVVPVDSRQRAQRPPDDRPRVVAGRASPAVTCVGGNSYRLFSSRAGSPGMRGTSGVCEIWTSLY